MHEQQTARRIRSHTAPVDAAQRARQLQRAARRRAVLVKRERRVGPQVHEPAAARPERLARRGVLRRRVLGAHHVALAVERDARHGRGRLHGERLRRRVPLVGHATLGHGPLLDAEHGLTRRAIEDEHVGGLADRRERGQRAAVALDVDEHGRVRQVEIPQVVVHGLEVPAIPTRRGIDGDDGIAEQIAAGPVAAPVVAGRARHRHVENSTRRVERHVVGPDVGARAVAPAVIEPRLVPRLTRVAARCGRSRRAGPCARRTRAYRRRGPD